MSRLITGSGTYRGHALRYRIIDDGPDGVSGELRFETERAPVRQFAAADALPDAPLRQLTLTDGSCLMFRVTGQPTRAQFPADGNADPDRTLRIEGHLEPA